MMLKNTEQAVLISHSADLFLQNNLFQVNILWKEERKVLWYYTLMPFLLSLKEY